MKPFLVILCILVFVIIPAGAVEAGQNGGGGDGRPGDAMAGAQSEMSHSVGESVFNSAKGESLSFSQDFGSGSAAKSEPSSGLMDETSPGNGESGSNGVMGPSATDPIIQQGGSAGASPPISPGTTGGQGPEMGNSADFEDGNGPEGNNPEGNNPEGNNPEGNNPEGNNPGGNGPGGNGPGGNNPGGNGPGGNGPEGNGPEGNGPEGSGNPGDPGSHVRWEYATSTSFSPIMAHTSASPGHGSGNPRPIPRMPFPATHAPYGEVPYGHIPATPVSQTMVVVTSAEQGPKRKEKSAPATGSAQIIEHDAASTVPESGIEGANLWKFFLLFGFSRLNRKNVLKNKYRSSIYSHICNNPGTDIGALADLLGLNRQTARYHVRILVSRGLVCEFQKHGATRYFQNNGIFSSFKKTLIHYLCTGTQGKMLFLLMHRPGLSRQEVADTLGISGPSVTWHARRLMEDGIINAESQGAFTRYSLSENAFRELLEDPSCTMIQSARVTRVSDQSGR